MKPFHKIAVRHVGKTITDRRSSTALSKEALHTVTVSHPKNTFYVAQVGEHIAGCIHREDGTPAAYSEAVTDARKAKGKALIDFALKGHDRTITEPKTSAVQRLTAHTSTRNPTERRSGPPDNKFSAG